MHLLTFTMLWADSADDKLIIFFSYFSYELGSDTSCKLSPRETICMKCQILGDNLHEVSDPIF